MPTMTARKPPHPGKITLVDGRTQQARVVDVSEVAESMRYARTQKGWEAVVKIVTTTEGTRFTWTAYAEDGRIIERGMGSRPAPRPA